jgi:Rnl2 family RNA ligase
MSNHIEENSPADKLVFKKFGSIKGVNKTKILKNILDSTPTDTQWVVTEKVHGANFSFITDGVHIEVARRNSILEPKDYKAFFGCGSVVKKYTDCAINLYREIFPVTEIGSQITIYGELFGNGYPKQLGSNKIVQKGVLYIPHLDFYAFDIFVSGSKDFYLDFDIAVGLFEKCGFLYAQELYRGTLDQVLKWSAEHNSDLTSIPTKFNLPDVKGNIREGHILRTAVIQYVGNDLVILKDKNEKFSEKKKEEKRKCASDETPPQAQSGLDIYITQQRLDNVISKCGTNICDNVHKLAGLFVQDILEEYDDDCKECSDDTDGKKGLVLDRNKMTKILMAKCINFIKNRHVNQL